MDDGAVMQVDLHQPAWSFDPCPDLDVKWCHEASQSRDDAGSWKLPQVEIQEMSDEDATALQAALETDLQRVASWGGKTAEEVFEETLPDTDGEQLRILDEDLMASRVPSWYCTACNNRSEWTVCAHCGRKHPDHRESFEQDSFGAELAFRHNEEESNTRAHDAYFTDTAQHTPEALDDDLGEGIQFGSFWERPMSNLFSLAAKQEATNSKQAIPISDLVWGLYDVLKVDRNTDISQLMKAYRRQATRHHPDRGGSVDQFQMIMASWDVLRDEEKRALYDAECRKRVSQVLELDPSALSKLVRLAGIPPSTLQGPLEEAEFLLNHRLGRAHTEVEPPPAEGVVVNVRLYPEGESMEVSVLPTDCGLDLKRRVMAACGVVPEAVGKLSLGSITLTDGDLLDADEGANFTLGVNQRLTCNVVEEAALKLRRIIHYANYQKSPQASNSEPDIFDMNFDIGHWGMHRSAVGTRLLLGDTAAGDAEEAAAVYDCFVPANKPPDRLELWADSTVQLLDQKACRTLIDLVDAEHSAAAVAGGVGQDARGTPTWEPLAGPTDFKLKLTIASLSQHVGADCVASLMSLFQPRTNAVEVKVRRCEPSGLCINFHLDHAQRTMQVPLIGDDEYTGGRIIFAMAEGLMCPSRPAGTATIHNCHVPHGVSAHTGGIRYSLFLLEQT